MGGESIDQAFVDQYQSNMIVLCQQRKSRLEETTIPPVSMTGENLFWERVGASEAVDLVSRHADTPNIEVDHSKRKSTATPKVWATLLDRSDDVRMIADPKNYYNQAGRMAIMRAKDRVIITALGGSSWAGRAGTTEVALPSAQKIAHGSVGLTLSKILTAREMMIAAEVDQEQPWYFVAAAQQQTNLLNTTEVKSADYNTVRALVSGQVDTFAGFKFIWTQLLSKSGTTRYCYAYAKGAIGCGVYGEIFTKIDQRADKNYAWQIYLSLDIGATRVEEEQVVEVACTEA